MGHRYTLKAGTFKTGETLPTWAYKNEDMDASHLLDEVVKGVKMAFDAKPLHPGRVVIQLTENE